MTKSRGDFPPRTPDLRTAQTDRDALAELPRELAANVLAYYGHAVGLGMVGPNTPANPKAVNGSGGYGHDHSGGLMGRPLYRSVLTLGANMNRAANPGFTGLALNGASLSAYMVAPNSQTGGSSEPTRHSCASVPFWVPPCDRQRGAYRAMAWSMLLYLSEGFGIAATDKLTTTISIEGGNSVPYAITNPADGVYKFQSAGDPGQLLLCEPGGLNLLRIDFEFDPIDGATRSLFAEVLELEVGVDQG